MYLYISKIDHDKSIKHSLSLRFQALHRFSTSFVVLHQETLAADIVGSVRERQQVGHFPTCAGADPHHLSVRRYSRYSHP